MLRIDVNHQDRIATLTLDRPEKRNALSLEFMEQLTCALDDIGQRKRRRGCHPGRQRPRLLIRS